MARQDGLVDLASCNVGGKALFATDEWFAVADNMLSPAEPVFIADKFTEFGKWMDGWETRRKRIQGHDWCIIRLGLPGTISKVMVDTAFFTGNNAPRCSIQAANLSDLAPEMLVDRESGVMGTACSKDDEEAACRLIEAASWDEVVPFTELGPGYPETRHNLLQAKETGKAYTHIRLNIYPDGGVARLRVYGTVQRDWTKDCENRTVVDLAALENGGVGVGASDCHYGQPSNMLQPGRGINMGDGWETARKKDRPAVLKLGHDGHLELPGTDWAVIKLGTVGEVTEVDVDTCHFKGNFPESCRLDGALSENAMLDGGKEDEWKPLTPRTKLTADSIHTFKVEEANKGPYSHVRLTIFPDGGVMRLRVKGVPCGHFP